MNGEQKHKSSLTERRSGLDSRQSTGTVSKEVLQKPTAPNVHNMNQPPLYKQYEANLTETADQQSGQQGVKGQTQGIEESEAELLSDETMENMESAPALNDNQNQAAVAVAAMKAHTAAMMEEQETPMAKTKSTKKRIQKYQKDLKEYQIEFPKLRAENKKLKLQNMDLDNFEQWNDPQILEWILSLEDGRLCKYETVLRASLKEEEVDGSLLGSVESADLKGWGVIKLSDRKFLQRQIAELVSKRAVPVIAFAGNEGGNL